MLIIGGSYVTLYLLGKLWVFWKIGLDWILKSKENILSHISCIEKDYKKHRKNEEAGKIPKILMNFENNIEPKN